MTFIFDTTKIMFQFTHPGRGATGETGKRIFLLSFNSRTPGGVRPIEEARKRKPRVVSIHAPREGCDGASLSFIYYFVEFQFTHPGRGATLFFKEPYCKRAFQFTHPGRGATRGPRFIEIFQGGFNSRTPGGVRQQ